MQKVFIKTYGCQMNERDSEAVASKLQARGYQLVSDETLADVILLNTCSVREQAEQKAIGKASHLVANRRKKNKKLILGVMGCMAQNKGDQILKSLPEVDLVVGTQQFHRVPQYLDEIVSSKKGESSSDNLQIIQLQEEKGSQNQIRDHLPQSAKKASAFVSIMQGCNMKCSFCIVPKTRGRERYRSISDIVEEAKGLSLKGVKEITLLGQIVNAYGRGEFPRVNGLSPFVQLLGALHEIDGIQRIRFTSPHPASFDQDLVEAFARLEKLGHYAHLPMQSGSNRILKSMNRPYSIERFQNIVKSLRTICPKIRLSTDIIVGYPGEIEEDFNLTKEAFETAGFEMGFIFKYSDRAGTPATIYPDKVPQEVKEQRNQELLSLLEKQSLASNLKLIGNKMEILVESAARKGNGDFLGRTKCFRKVLFPGHQDLVGELIEVDIQEANPGGLRATPSSLF